MALAEQIRRVLFRRPEPAVQIAEFRARSWCWFRLCRCRSWVHGEPHPYAEGDETPDEQVTRPLARLVRATLAGGTVR